MLLYISENFTNFFSILNLFSYITLRTGGAILTALFFSLIFGGQIIKFLSSLQPTGQPIRNDGPETHIISKVGTPTMGGLLILSSILFSALIWSNLKSPFIWITLFSTVSFGFIGLFDDYKKIKSQSTKGLRVSNRIFLQMILSFIIVIFIYYNLPEKLNTGMNFPFFKNFFFDFGLFFIPISMFIIIGSANSVNLTDGLDGLAIVPVLIAFLSFGFIAYVCGNMIFANYLQISFVSGSGEISVICGAIAGSALGFLWFNAPPAKVFMGDTGSLSLGATLGTVALITKHEVVLAIIGGLFVFETLSVIIQVLSFKLTGKRVFRMAPLHHHFEKKGWPESTIVKDSGL